MKSIKASILLSLCITAVVGCSTTGTFVVPEGSNLYINQRQQPVEISANGQVSTKPYFWNAIGGVPYRLEKNGEVLKEGKLRAKFRPVSIFWPPYALIYWPAGLNPDITYDLVNDTQE